MHKQEKFIEARADRILLQKLPDSLYLNAFELSISAWEVPSEPVSFDAAMLQTFTPFTPDLSGANPGEPPGFALKDKSQNIGRSILLFNLNL